MANICQLVVISDGVYHIFSKLIKEDITSPCKLQFVNV
jgi:hypothetical protein